MIFMFVSKDVFITRIWMWIFSWVMVAQEITNRILKNRKKYTEITIVILSSSAGKSFKFNPKDHEYKENGAINHVTS